MWLLTLIFLGLYRASMVVWEENALLMQNSVLSNWFSEHDSSLFSCASPLTESQSSRALWWFWVFDRVVLFTSSILILCFIKRIKVWVWVLLMTLSLFVCSPVMSVFVALCVSCLPWLFQCSPLCVSSLSTQFVMSIPVCFLPQPKLCVLACVSACFFLFYFESLSFSFTSPVSRCLIPLSCVPMSFLVSVWVHTTILSIYDHDKLKSPMARMWSG